MERNELALVNLETYYSILNIHIGNTCFRYYPDDGANWFPITMSTGSYGIEDINDEILRQQRLNDHKVKIGINANRVTLEQYDPPQALPSIFQSGK